MLSQIRRIEALGINYESDFPCQCGLPHRRPMFEKKKLTAFRCIAKYRHYDALRRVNPLSQKESGCTRIGAEGWRLSNSPGLLEFNKIGRRTQYLISV